MKDLLEKIWNEYFCELCSEIENKKERALLKNVCEMHEALNKLLTKEQNEVLDKYVEAIYENQAHFIKKAFFRRSEFTTSFIFEVRNVTK